MIVFTISGRAISIVSLMFLLFSSSNPSQQKQRFPTEVSHLWMGRSLPYETGDLRSIARQSNHRY